MKKFITVSPFQDKDKLKKGIYHAIDNSALQYDREISFPILSVINGYASAGEEIEVICIQSDMTNAIENTKVLDSEMKQLCGEKNLTYTLTILSIAYNNLLETHLNTFYQLIEHCQDSDELYICTTYGFKPLSIVEMSALSYASRIKKDIKVGCVVYGENDYQSGEMRIYDVTSLYLLNEVIDHLAQANVENPLKQIELLLGVEQ